ncbi:MAG: hypothetical protein Q7J28_04380 [Caulobacter sp.]|nr:hypothetical protein [Caulobacter sp.]
MYRSFAAFVAAGALLAGQAAIAAEGARVSGVSGSVMVSQNGRFVPAANGAVLRAGDRVVASSGSARVVYGDGCNVAISARSMATVAAASPCVGGSSDLVKISTRADDDDRGAYGYGDNTDLYLWLGFGVVTAVVTAVALEDDSDPNSP